MLSVTRREPRLASLLVVCVAGVLAANQEPPPRSPAEALYHRVTPSIATLSVENRDGSPGIGTAFLAIGEGLAVTAWHVVQEAVRVTARFADGTEVEVGGVVDWDATRDLAILRLPSNGRPRLPVSTEEPGIGSRVYAIGAPRGLEFSLSDGLVSQLQRGPDGTRFVQFSAPVSPGSSGGPLVSSTGEVVGVVSQQLTASQNLNLAVAANYLLGMATSSIVRPWPSIPTGLNVEGRGSAGTLAGVAGTYVGAWTSAAGYSGAAVLSVSETADELQGAVKLTGSPIGYRGDDVAMKVTKAGGGVWYVEFKGRSSRLTGTGIFRNGTFVGDYRYVRILAGVDDRGQWILRKSP